MTFLQRCETLRPLAACLILAGLILPGTLEPKPSTDKTVINHDNDAEPTVRFVASIPVDLEATLEKRQEILATRIAKTYKTPEGLAERIVKAAHRSGAREQIDPVLLLALVGVESSFRPNASNPSGAIGLTQTIPRWHPEKIAAIEAAGKSPMDPEANLAMGARILAEYTEWSKGNRMRALQRYNGATNDRKQRYANKVMALYRKLSAGLPQIKIDPTTMLAMEQINPFVDRKHPLLAR